MEAFRALPVFVAVTLALPLLVSAAERDQDSETATRPEYGLKLNAARRLDENAPSEEGDAPTYLTAFKMIGTPNEKIELIDSAEVRRGGSVLRGDTITYTFANDEVYSNGKALVARNGTIFKGPELTYHLDAETGEMPNATFRYLPTQMRGTSDKIELLGEGKAKMCNAMVTTCREGEEAWWIKASDIDYDELDGSAVGRNARLYVGGIPVFASPYFSFPVGSERKTGFLTPRFGMSSTLGVNMKVPFYWNIAPNYDYTLTLKPMSKRGVLFGNEFRYLQPTFSGQVDYNVIFKDKETHERRYGVAWKHYQRIGDVSLGVDYQKVSDNDYLSDFSTTIRESSENVLNQNFWISYGQTYWSTSLGVYKNQTLRPNNKGVEKPYEKEPEFNLSGYVADFHGAILDSRLTATRFRRGISSYNGQRGESGDGNRTLWNTSISYPLMGSYWFFTPKVTYSFTHYNDIKHAKAGIDSSSSRSLPIYSLDTGLIFERNSTIFGRETEQTLEPRLFYAYIPYRNQRHMPNFDSSLADLNFAELFTPNKYSGYDRIANTNQLSAVLTTRYIDSGTGKEWFSATVGQRYYFTDEKVDLYWDTPGKTKNRSDVLAATQFSLFEGWRLEGAIQYSTEWSKISKTSAGIRYNPRDFSTVALYYRYNYNPNDKREDFYNTNIKQVDFSFQWPIMKDLYGLGRYNYSFRDKKVVDSLMGLEYRAGCWILRGAVQRYIRSEGRSTTNFFLELELVGLGTVGSSPIQALSEGITGYKPVGPKPVEVGRYDYYE